MEVIIKLFGQNVGECLTLINGSDANHIYVMTDADERQIEIDIDQLKMALKKMTAR